MKKTRIVATVGPACNNYETLRSMIVEGVNVFRLNFSHGSQESHKSVIDDIRRLNKELVTNVAILGDLQGPKLRVGEIENGSIELAPNASVVFTNTCIISKLLLPMRTTRT